MKLENLLKDGKIEARVHPVFLPQDHPLSSVANSFNAVFVVGDAVGDIMIYGRGAGDLPTGSAIVSDIVYCARQVEHARYSEMFNEMTKDDIIQDFESAYYVRMTVHDAPGVLADVTTVLKKYNISISQIKQDKKDDIIPIIFVTRKTSENAMNKAIDEIKALKNIINVENVIRVEE